MKAKRSTPVKLKQSKITAFCSTSENNGGNWQVNRKRKNAEEVSEVHKTPFKRAPRTDSTSPDIFQVSPEKNQRENICDGKNKGVENDARNDFENFIFDDLENDPFLSPRKKESPKKNILTENLSINETWAGEKSGISFETSVKCRVIKATFLTGKHFEQVLLLSDVKSNGRGVCRLRDVWTSFAFSPDDVISVQATDSKGEWVVDNQNGHVILYPDVTISSTTLTKSMFCMRQGILSNYFKEMDSEGSNRMLIGRLIHELFQESLKTSACSNEDLYKIVADLMQSRDNLHNFYFSNMTLSDIQKEVKNFIPRVRNFLQAYVNKQMTPAGGNFEGTIDDVMDIEELIKSPALGLQGRIDVTVKMTSKRGKEIAPLELKTGKASFSNEHRSQLVLYILLMNELGRKVHSGLLLYLREDILEEILPQRDEIRNLFLLRNHFVDVSKRFGACVLPEPIRNTKFCTRCPQLRNCTTYLRDENSDRLSESHPLKSLEIPDLTPSHADYFLKWSKMLCLEYQEVFQDVADEYEISGLTLEPNGESFNEEFKCNFRRENKSGERTFLPGTFVQVTDGKNNRICTGRVFDVTDSLVSVITEKRLDEFSEVYKLVAFKSKFLSTYLSNLGWFLNAEFESLRQLIVDKRAPVFEKNFDKAEFKEKCLKFLLDLNKQQQKAVLKAILCRDYVLIKGPPGTGKTQTILTLVKILLALSKTVLIASHTHSSVDNILLRLDGVEYLRLGSLKSIRKEIHGNSYSYLIGNCSSVDDVKKLFDRKLIASTCLGIDTDFVRKIKVEYCIVDESSQVLQPEILRPLFCCQRFVLVGDEDQLPPIVRSPEAKRLGMSESLFERLNGENSIVRLNLQYRMNSVINSLVNAVTYGGLIECGNEEVAKATMKIPDREAYLGQDEWIVDVLSNDLEKSVVFVDTSEYFRRGDKESEQRSSLLEANIILRLITCLIKFGLKKENVGVITPFWDQITLLMGKLEESKLREVELNTVEQYQGRDKEVILFSCTKENQANKEVAESELLNDEKRLTVALTRAKHKLIIVGDKQTVARYKPFQKLIKNMSESQFYRLSDGQKNFFWENFVN